MAIVDVSLIAFLALIVGLMVTPERGTVTTHTVAAAAAS